MQTAYHPAAIDVILHGEEGEAIYAAREIRRQIIAAAKSLTDTEERIAYMAAVLGAGLEEAFRAYVDTAPADDILAIADELGLEA